MLRLFSALTVAFFLAVAAFVVVESYSASFQYCKSQTTNEPSSDKSENRKSGAMVTITAYFRCTGQFADRHNGLITAFATILLGVITFGLILSGIDQQKTTRAQLRAYLSVETGISFRQSNRYHTRFEFRPNIINNGQTPASKVRILSKIDFVPIAIPDNFDFALQRPPNFPPGSVSTIAPGKFKFHSSVFYRFLTWRELRDHAKGIKQFHLWGQVTYEDIFRVERHTYFSFLILVPTKKRNEVLWLATDRHNYYD